LDIFAIHDAAIVARNIVPRMRPSFEFAITNLSIVTELPNAWSEDQCRALLQQLEFEDAASTPAAELRSYIVMTLQDLKPAEAARALLHFVFGDEMTEGKKNNLGEEMLIERCWEEYADIECHERLFNAQVMLNEAHPDAPQPEIHRIEAVFSSLNEAAASWLQENVDATAQPNLSERLLVRSMAAAVPEKAILNRLFEDQIGGAEFAEAEHLLWQIQATAIPATDGRDVRYQLSLYSPLRWSGDLEEGLTVACEPFLGD
tara:strand:+ start:13864 stop:14643 length:780 start_codon:yes stop_codon:yes gene_type:complete